MHRSGQRSGFTFIEMAIAIAIVALVVGAIVFGRELITVAKVRSATSQIGQYRQALNSFRLKYNALPGDLTTQQATSFGMEPTSREGGEGITHGNELIEADSGEYVSDGGYSWSAGRALAYENILFWRDLSSVGLIDNKLVAAIDGPAVSLGLADIGLYLPEAKTGRSGFWAVVAAAGENYLALAGIPGTDNAGSILPTNSSLTAAEAYGIDRKLDDGVPATGTVKSSGPASGEVNYLVNAPGGSGCIAGDAPYYYDTSGSTDATCTLAIGFRPGISPAFSEAAPEAPPSSCSLPWGGSIDDGQSVTAYSNSGACNGNSSETRSCNAGLLGGSYEYDSCRTDCDLPWGGTINDGQSAGAYQFDGQPCATVMSESRTCTQGALSGSYTAQSCRTDCDLPWGGTINDGQSMMAYQNAGACSGATSELRNCNGGVLSGSYTNQSCRSDCDLPWGGTIDQGQWVTAYESNGACDYTASQQRTCFEGVLSGSFTYQNCRMDCDLPWGGTIENGQNVIAYANGGACNGNSSEYRGCNNGVLNGSYTAQNCRSDCDLPWGGTINDGQSATAYQYANYTQGDCNSSESRSCNNGLLEGSYQNQSCTPPAPCNLPWGGTINDGQSVTAWQDTEGLCNVSEQRTCSNGVLSGSYTSGSCNPTQCSLPWGGWIWNNTGVTAYHYPDHDCWDSEYASCNAGAYSGTYQFESCSE